MIRDVFFKILDKFAGANAVLVSAISGGPDSICLTLLAHEWCVSRNKKLIAVTVDHSLRDESAVEALYVHDLMAKFGIFHIIKKWDHGMVPDNKIETYARAARYDILKSVCDEFSAQALLVGHNLNEQVETYFMRQKMRSSEIGLAGMSVARHISSNVVLLRPLLSIAKTVIENFLHEKNISWIRDPMNENTDFIRVQMREVVNHMPANDFKKNVEDIVRYGERRQEIDVAAVEFLKRKCCIYKTGFASCDIHDISGVDFEIQKEVLKRIIKSIGGKYYSISDSDCLNILNKNFVYSIANVRVRTSNKKILFVRENRNLKLLKLTGEKAIWDNRFEITLSEKISGNVEIGTAALAISKGYKGYLKMEIPSYVFSTLPAIFIDKNPVYVYNVDKPFDKVSFNFLPKADFFDIFCCLDKTGVLL